jgi:hypothetical protein
MQDRLCAAIVLAILAIAVAGCTATGQSANSPGQDGHPPFLAVSITRQPSADFSGSPAAATVKTKENQVFAGIHRFEAGAGALDVGLDYQYTRYVFEGIDGRNRDLHRFQFPMRYQGRIDGWTIDGSIAPGISTSSNVLKEFFDRISGDDLFVTARFEGRRESGPRNWVLGLAYDRTFGRPLPYPIVGLEFSPGDELDLRFAFPDSGFQYRWSDRYSLSGRLFPAGHQWHVMTDDFDAEFDYRVEGFRAQLGWSIRLWKQVTLDVSGGYEFGRRHYLTDDLGVRIESDVEDQWLFLIGLRAGPAPLPYTHGSQL